MNSLILIIDDDYHVRYMLKEIIEYGEWQSIEAKNGLDGLEMANKFNPDLIIVDYHMPEMDGLSMIKNLKASNSSIPILVLTVDERQEIANKFLENGASDFALKPVKAPDLISRIKLNLKFSNVTEKAARTEYDKDEELGFNVEKGFSKEIISKILEFLEETTQPRTTEEISKSISISYPTTNKYLNYLENNNLVISTQVYGKVGRPQKQFLIS